jgi:hypothetical protein
VAQLLSSALMLACALLLGAVVIFAIYLGADYLFRPPISGEGHMAAHSYTPIPIQLSRST